MQTLTILSTALLPVAMQEIVEKQEDEKFQTHVID
jgi:hypothetical protein